MNVDVRIGAQVPRRGSARSRWLGRTVLRLLGWRVEGDVPDHPKMVLIGVPHTSNMDGVLGLNTLVALGLDATTMIKDSAFRGPLGWLLRTLGAIPINRRSPKGVVEQSVEAFQQRPQLLMLIAAEGTRHSATGFKRGFYYIAQGAGVPVLAATVHYRERVVRFGPLMWPSGDFEADVLPFLEFWKRCGWPQHPERLSKPLCEAMGLTYQPSDREPPAGRKPQ